MNLITVLEKFPTQEACIAHLENARWGDCPVCPHCSSENAARKKENHRVGRWNCHDCKSSFNVLSGTIFQGTKVPLQKWFLAIAILLNAKKSVSSHQLARDLGMNPKTAWFLNMRIREGMVDDSVFLHGIVEADETYVGGKPRKSDRNDDDPPKRGRGTKKQPILGAVARGGKVVAQPAKRVTGETLKAFLSKFVKADDSVLMTDEFPGYNRMGEWVPHFTINHAVAYAQGLVHTNTIEGFWSLVKRAIIGQHHHYSKEHAAAYIVEACYKYNNRHADTFDSFLQGAVAG
ncbi:MAG: IS1595 family transposase [Candidatus Poribacteria bacterium]|nr:IS1595 family transposase [Candidatus Poribacteria bacterium]